MKRLNCEGFALLETLVAIAMFAIMLGAFVSLMNQEILLIARSSELLTARLKANEVMETLKLTPFEALPAHSSVKIPNLKKGVVDVAISDFDSKELKKIIVTVKWTNSAGQNQRLVLTTLRTKPTLNKI